MPSIGSFGGGVKTSKGGLALRPQVSLISRRSFGGILVCLVAAPCAAFAQSRPVVRRIGMLASSGDPATADCEGDEDLRKLGWLEGRNLHVECRFANGRDEALNALAEELVRANVEVIVTQGSPETLAAMRATKTIPIVFSVGDAVALGIVKSLARPGGNATGLSFAGPEVEAKHLTILKELLPTVRRIGVFEPAAHPYFRSTRDGFERSCRSLGLEPIFVEVAASSDIDGAMAHLARGRVQIVILRSSSFVQHYGMEITNAALKYRLATMAEQSELVREGTGLISYTGVIAEIGRRRWSYVDRILRGAKPGDLPVEQPTQYEMVINLKTAKLLGLVIPQSIMLRADEVIR
ncbi:MAG: ABC transporter substrate-binding protein [Betaproteobacteria bacterium]